MGETTKLIANRIFAILTGVVAGAIVIGLLEMVSHSMHPLPEGLDTTNPEAFRDYIMGLPFTAFLFLLIAHGVGAMAGGFIASKMASVQKRGAALFVGFILVLAGVLNLLTIPHPLWFSIADVLIYTPMALLGDKIRASIFKAK
jgi:hypothetical protein